MKTRDPLGVENFPQGDYIKHDVRSTHSFSAVDPILITAESDDPIYYQPKYLLEWLHSDNKYVIYLYDRSDGGLYYLSHYDDPQVALDHLRTYQKTYDDNDLAVIIEGLLLTYRDDLDIHHLLLSLISLLVADSTAFNNLLRIYDQFCSERISEKIPFPHWEFFHLHAQSNPLLYLYSKLYDVVAVEYRDLFSPNRNSDRKDFQNMIDKILVLVHFNK